TGAPVFGRADARCRRRPPARLLLGPTRPADHTAALALLGKVRQARTEPPLPELEKVLAQRPAGEALPQEQPPQVRMAGKPDAEQVVDLVFLEVGAPPHRRDGRH